jgi:HSP20 family protein
MTKVTRSDPFVDIVNVRNTMDKMLDDYFGHSALSFEGYGIFDLDMYQTDDEVVVEASIPGVKPEEINISISGEVLTIKGEIKQEKESENVDYHIRERRYGSFSRSITLPVLVVADKANAEFKNGVLKLTLPKAEEIKPKTITVKAK